MYLWLVIVGGFASFYNSWGVGANDCANSFATSVGSKVLTLKQAVITAGIFEFSGAFLMGSHVTSAIRKNIVNVNIYEDDPSVLMLGMLCSNISAGLWLHLASYLKLPVSTTHSIIGSIIGFTLAYGGSDGVNINGIVKIVLSWVISPLLSGLFSLTFYSVIKKFVFQKDDALDRTVYIFPFLTFFTFLISTFFIIYKGTPQLNLDETSLTESSIISISISLFISIMSWYLYIPYARKKMKQVGDENIPRTLSYISVMEDTVEVKDLTSKEKINQLKEEIKEIKNREKYQITNDLHSNASLYDKDIEKLCSPLQVITACFSSFAHGANDVSNSIAPFATIYGIHTYGEISKNSDVPIWILFMGGAGIVLGLATWGYRVIERIGKDLTKITPSRGFIIELSSSLTTLIASRANIPVSTTHCQIGSVVGCGIADKKNNVKWSLVREIVLSWFVTLPACGLMCAALFSFGHYSP